MKRHTTFQDFVWYLEPVGQAPNKSLSDLLNRYDNGERIRCADGELHNLWTVHSSDVLSTIVNTPELFSAVACWNQEAGQGIKRVPRDWLKNKYRQPID